MERTIFHIDVNSAYLSWEAVYRLQHGDLVDLRTIPAVVGGDPITRHGIVLAKSIPAKPFNIQTGESLMEALKKCPILQIIPPRYSLYVRSSNAMMALISRYASQIQRYSIDECFVDFTESIALFGDGITAAHHIKEAIKNELGFTVSIGISSNKLLAKVASDLKKPDAVSTLFPHEIPLKMWPLPVGDLFMVGRSTVPKLANMGIFTVGDLANANPDLLHNTLKSHGLLIWNYANGREYSQVKKSNHLSIKSIGNSTTIAFDVDNRREAHLVLLSLTEMVGMRLRSSGFLARLVSVHIKTSAFTTTSMQEKFLLPTNVTSEIYARAKKLFDALWTGETIRHLGISVSEFCEDDFIQTSFFDSALSAKRQKLDAAIDVIRERFEPGILMRGALLGSGIKPMTGGVSEDDFPMMASIL